MLPHYKLSSVAYYDLYDPMSKYSLHSSVCRYLSFLQLSIRPYCVIIALRSQYFANMYRYSTLYAHISIPSLYMINGVSITCLSHHIG